MFSRKKRELIKTPSISKKSRAGSPVPQTLPVSVTSGTVGALRAPTELLGRATTWQWGPGYVQEVCEKEENEKEPSWRGW